MATTLTLANPLTSAVAQQLGLSARDYAVGEQVSVDEWAARILVRVGYGSVAVALPVTLTPGDGPPSSGLGTEGGYWLDRLNKVLYGPKTNGGWPISISPGRGIQSAVVDSSGRLQLTYSDGARVDAGPVQGVGAARLVIGPTRPANPPAGTVYIATPV